MAIIEDGKGSGKKAEVNAENRLLTHAITQTLEHHSNVSEGTAYQLLFQKTPSSADCCFVYMKNGNGVNLIVEGILLRTSSDEQIEVKLKTTGTAVGTAAVPANCNAGSGNNADGTFIVDDGITGLTHGNTVERFYITGSNTSSYYNFEQDLIVPPNQTLCLHAVTGGIEIDGTLVFHYHQTNS
jgi:hypothetical protein